MSVWILMVGFQAYGGIYAVFESKPSHKTLEEILSSGNFNFGASDVSMLLEKGTVGYDRWAMLTEYSVIPG